MKLCTRQICFIMLVYSAASKLLLYPTFLASYCGRDLLFPCIINFAIQAVIIWAICFLCSKTDKTFFELIEGTLGNIAARIVFGLFALVFLLSALLPLFEQKLYVHSIFYDTVPSLLVFLPFFFFSVYAGGRGLKNIGRCADICLPVFIVSLIFILAMSALEIKWENFLPVLKTPVPNLVKGSLNSFYRFVEPCWLLMFMGKFKYHKWDAAKITLSYLGGAVIVLVVLLTFYGVYGDIAVSRQFAISKISLFFPAIEMIGRVDLLALYVLETVMLFALVLNIQLAVECISDCTGYKNKNVISLIANAVLMIILIVFNNNFSAIHDAYTNWLWIVFVVFAVAVPLAALILRGRKNG